MLDEYDEIILKIRESMWSDPRTELQEMYNEWMEDAIKTILKYAKEN